MKTWIPDSRKFAYLNWKQVEALPKLETLLVLPTAAIEQHGHHLPIATDTLINNLLLGKALVFGPNMQNFADVTRTFLAQNAAVQVRDPEALERAVADLIADEEHRAELGRNALKVVAENLGAVDRTVAIILEQLKARGIYIAPGK